MPQATVVYVAINPIEIVNNSVARFVAVTTAFPNYSLTGGDGYDLDHASDALALEDALIASVDARGRFNPVMWRGVETHANLHAFFVALSHGNRVAGHV